MIEQLPPEALALGSDPSLLGEEMKFAIREHANANPRNAQVEIGASEVGTPCVRKLAYKLGNVPPVNPESGTWAQLLGTFIHQGLADMLESWNHRLIALGEYPRWATEEGVIVGKFGKERFLRGHGDVYDRVTASVLDWKSHGLTQLKKIRRNGHPGQTYRVQLHCYGRAFANLGLPVETVHIFAVPQGGQFTDFWHWSEPYDPTVADWALNRAHALTEIGESVGWTALGALSATYHDYCEYCPWFSAFNPDPFQGQCPGSDEIQAERSKRMNAEPPLPFG